MPIAVHECASARATATASPSRFWASATSSKARRTSRKLRASLPSAGSGGSSWKRRASSSAWAMSLSAVRGIRRSPQELVAGGHGMNDQGTVVVDDADLQQLAGGAGPDQHDESQVEIERADRVAEGVT